VIVESHPALIGEPAPRFRDLLNGKLEVAMGLETAHPEVLGRLNKRMTLDQFARAANFLREHDIALRVFVLVKPPFLDEAEALEWANRSLDFAFDCGASVASLIPTRFGNGALETLVEQGEFSPPQLATIEEAAAYGVNLRRGRVFADLWDLEKFSMCKVCLTARRLRLERMNLTQTVEPPVVCERCSDLGSAGASPSQVK
jgi:radical SAM enzyme (TIGR01210 family)